MLRPTFLMCPPRHFGVSYVINPWMEGNIGGVDLALAEVQWAGLLRVLTEDCGAVVRTIEPQVGVPDMVFTANAGLVHRDLFVPSRFRYHERQAEETFFEDWFRSAGYCIQSVAGHNEGAGDMLFGQSQIGETVLFAAFGFRSDVQVQEPIAFITETRIVSLELVDPRFYHLDTCFCPLPGGRYLWFPDAFSPQSRVCVEHEIAPGDRFEVSESDALNFVCNAVGVAGHVVVGSCELETRRWLENQGFIVHVTPLSEFMKAGGSAKCLSLRLDEEMLTGCA